MELSKLFISSLIHVPVTRFRGFNGLCLERPDPGIIDAEACMDAASIIDVFSVKRRINPSLLSCYLQLAACFDLHKDRVWFNNSATDLLYEV